MNHATFVALLGLAATIAAVYATGSRPTLRRALAAIAAAIGVFLFDATFMICRCFDPKPWSQWTVLAACFAITIAAVGHPWLRRTLALAIVVAGVAAGIH